MVNRKIILSIAAIACSVMMFLGCAEKITLYATWADAQGNSIMFNEQKGYTAKFAGMDSAVEGTFVWSFNTIVLTDVDGNQTFMEWDIRGNTLYLTFTDSNDEEQVLALYKVGEAVNVGEEEE